MKALYLSFVLSFVYYSMSAQLSGTSEVSILSPKAASIIKYGEHPVSLHTGLVDISVPVYTIEGHGISVPISFKYHASGLKFDDVSNEVGLGWSLIAGGVITHSFRGARDGLYGTFSRDVTTFTTCNDSSLQDNEYVRLREVENGSRGNFATGAVGRLDGEIDMYSFSFLNHSGSFCFPFLNSEVSGTAPSTGLFIPASGMKATRSNNQKIEIVDIEGIYYKFEVKDVDQNQSYKEYYLTQIISADKTDTVDFVYEVMSSNSIYVRRPFINYTSSVTLVTQIFTAEGMYNDDVAFESGGIYYQSLRPPRLKRINFRGGYVTFDYAVVNSIPTWDLQQVKIYNNTQSAPLQTVSLTKGSFYNGEKRLDKVTFTNREGQSYDYEFGYLAEPADIDSAPGIDYWGYFNGASVPYGKRYAPIVANAHVLMYQGTDRNANEGQMQKGILNKITYPTKGYSEFVYEAHKARYSLAQPIQTFGGVRIKEIRNYLSDGTLAEKKWYKYGEMVDTNGDGIPDQECGYGTTGTFLTPSCEDFVSETRALVTHWDSDGGLEEHLCKLKVTKTFQTFPRISYFQSGSSVIYGRVTEYVGTSVSPTGNINEDYGKTVYSYEVTPDEKISSTGDTYRLYSVNESQRTFPWRNGNLLTKEVYKKEGTTYKRIYRLRNNYTDINAAEFRNIRVRPNVEFEYNYTNGSPPDIKRNFCVYPEHRQYFGGYGPGLNLCPYDYFNYYTTTAQRVLTSTEEIMDGVTTTTVYNTYNAYGLPTSFSRTNSKGENFNTALKYPTDYTFTPYTNMISKNILTPVIEKTISKNGTFLKREGKSYSNFYGHFYAPGSYWEQYQNGISDIEKEYGYNSRGNIEHFRVRGKSKSVYLWGYNNRYPIAHIENATWDQIYGILGGALIDRVAQAETPSSADLTAINNLRTNTSIPGALVTTYAYIPLVGMASQTDPNGITTYFENDSFGRLKYTKDNEGNILQAYEYRYKQ